MADNVAITAGLGTSIGADDISSVLYQRVKLIHGADGVNAGDVAVGNPLPVGGGVADDAAVAGSPLLIGANAVETDGTDPTSVSAEGDVALLRADRNRRLLVNIRHPNSWTATEKETSAATNDPIKAAPGANLSLYITDIIISNGATAGNIKFVEDTAGTPVTLIEEVYLGVNSGAALHFKTPIRVTANKDFGYTSATMTTHSVTVCGYTAP